MHIFEALAEGDATGDIPDSKGRSAADLAQSLITKAVKQAHFAPGTRVIFQFGAEAESMHGEVMALTFDREGQRAAWVRIIGAWIHCEPLANLTRVCGECEGCKALNQRPGCVS